MVEVQDFGPYQPMINRNNVYVGEVTNINSVNNVVGKQKPIILAGLNAVFVVESEEVILIGHKELMEEVKNIKKVHDE